LVLRALDRRSGRLAAPERPSTRVSVLAALAASTALCAPLAAFAGPVTVSNNSTTALRTTTGDGQGPGNITVDAAGTITVSTGIPVTVDSNNDATISGTLRNDAPSGATGLLINTNDAANVGQSIISNITLNGIVNVPGPPSPQAAASNNFGIRFSGNGTMRGNYLANTGAQIAVGGREAVGIAVDSAIDGSFTSNASITAAGGGSVGIRTTRAISGNVALNGTLSMAGQDSIGALIAGPVGGTFTFTTTSATGSQAFFDSNSRRVDAVPGGPALWVAGSVGGGVLLEGNRVSAGLEASNPPASTAPADSILASEGSSIGAFRIGPTAQSALGPLTLGVRENGDSVIMRGRVQSSTSTLGRAILAMGIAGNGPGQSLVMTGGIRNDGGNIDAVSIDAAATGLEIGGFATIPHLINAGEFIVRATDSTENTLGTSSGSGGGAATGITIAATSVFNTFVNTGTFTVDARGRSFNAIALQDNSGTLAYFENTGTYEAIVRSISTGRTIAADLSRSTRNIDFRNSGTLRGDVTFGSGNDSFLSTGGTVIGNYTFGAGDDRVTIRNTTFTGAIDLGAGNHAVSIESGSKFSGGVVRTGGTTTFAASNSDVSITGGRRIEMTTGIITGTSALDISIDSQNATRPLIEATGRLVIDPTVRLTTRLSGLVTQSSTVTVISAGDLQFGIPLSQLASASTSYIYGFQYRIAPTNRNQLLLDVTRRSAQQLGLAPNMSAVYENALTALAADNELFSVIAGTTTKEGFEGAIQQLMPTSSDASLYAALRSQNLAYGVIRNRLAGIPRTTGNQAGVDYSSFWVQQLGSYGKRDAEAEQPGYHIYTVGIATGFDTQLTPDLKGGMSLAQVWSLPNESGTPDKATRISTTQLDFYGRHQTGAAYTQAIFGGSYNTYRSQRRVVLGTLVREPEGRWKGFNVGAAVDTGTQIRLSDVRWTPYLRGSYIRAQEKSYTETGGGNGVNLSYDSRTQDSMRAGAGFIAQRRFVVFQDVGIETELRGDVARELSADPANVTARFTAGGATFTNVGQRLDKNVFGLGASIGVRDIFTALSLDYDAEKSGDFLGHTISATFRFRF
jgi:uncharacterized protein with beta-barrel porin domain